MDRDALMYAYGSLLGGHQCSGGVYDDREGGWRADSDEESSLDHL